MFFIDNDESEIFQGRENSAARADYNPRATRMNLVPFIVALALGQMTVQNSDVILCLGEPALEAFHCLWRKRDFGDENNCCPSAVEGRANGLEVNFRLAGTRDAVEQDRTCVLRGIECLSDFT